MFECYKPPQGPLNYLYQDESIVVINKPAGLLSVPGRGDDKIDSVMTRLQADGLSVGNAVHRLDLPTSGLMVWALSKQAHRTLSQSFEQKQVQKMYLAWVLGTPEQDEGLIDLPLVADWPNRPRQKVDLELGKLAQTRFMYVKSSKSGRFSLLKLWPFTGRTHQLRLHCMASGFAILGDNLYGEARKFAPRLCLHAASLAFNHPLSDEYLHFVAPPDEDFAALENQ